MAGEGVGGLESVISKLMSDPGLMATVNAAVAGMKSGDGSTSAEGKEQSEAEEKKTPHAGGDQPDLRTLSLLSSMLGGGTGSDHRVQRPGNDEERRRRCALLSALKPYLDKHRCETIDCMLGIERLGEALKTVGKP